MVQNLNKNLNDDLYWRLRHAYFGAIIGDIFKAIRGGSTMGAFTLSMCSISSFAELWWCNKNQNFVDNDGRNLAKRKHLPDDRDLFIDWAQKWLNGGLIDYIYDTTALYALRCSLAHSYGWSRQLNNAALDGFRFCHRRPEKHRLTDRSQKNGYPSYCLNLENFVADIVFAADNCIENLVPSQTDGFLNYVKALTVPLTLDIEGRVVVDPQKISLDFVDKRLSDHPLRITKEELIDKINNL